MRSVARSRKPASYDWTSFDNIYETYRTGDSAKWALTQVRKKGLRDFGPTLGAGGCAPPRHRCGNAGAADGTAMRKRPCADRIPGCPRPGQPRLLPGTARHTPNMNANDGAVPAPRGPVQFRTHGGRGAVRVPEPSRGRHQVQQSRRQPHAWRFPLRTRSTTKWARSGGPAWGSPTR